MSAILSSQEQTLLVEKQTGGHAKEEDTVVPSSNRCFQFANHRHHLPSSQRNDRPLHSLDKLHN